MSNLRMLKGVAFEPMIINPCDARTRLHDEQGHNMRKSCCWIARHARHLLKEAATKSSRQTAVASCIDNSPDKMSCSAAALILTAFFTRVLGSYYGEAGLRELQMIVSLSFSRFMKNALQHEI